MMESILPISLRVAGRPCVVVGGGEVAAHKARSLLSRDARVTVISPALNDDLAELKADEKIAHIERAYQPGDLDGAYLAIAATTDNEVNRAVFDEARQRKVLINVVDVPELCDFYYPSIVQRGALTISIATNGIAPALCQALREELEREFDDSYGELLELLSEARPVIKRKAETFAQRQRIWKTIVSQREDLLSLLRQGKAKLARERINSCISSP